MTLHPRQFVRLVDGRLASPATIALLPGHLGARIGCTTNEIRITKEYATKILQEHRLKFEHFSLVQPIVDRGWCVKLKENHLEFYYDDDQIFGGNFTFVLKSTKWGTECWAVTLFRARPYYIRSKLKRASTMDTVYQYHDGAAELLG